MVPARLVGLVIGSLPQGWLFRFTLCSSDTCIRGSRDGPARSPVGFESTSMFSDERDDLTRVVRDGLRVERQM